MLPKIVLILFFLLSCKFLLSQQISGVINEYSKVQNINNEEVTVNNAGIFQPCDKVLIIQMKGAQISEQNNINFGQISDILNAGNFEFNYILSINGNIITLSSPLQQIFSTNGNVQLVKVPVFSNPIVTAELTCTAWNGQTGGLIVFESLGPVTLQANINASEKGFRGGQIASGAFGCNESNYATMIHGKKGEGVSIASNGLDANRAPLANGGGGSSSGNFGSGGGSHVGAGGRGGDEYSGCFLNGLYGFGGYPLFVNESKLFLGGGGGGGYRDNNQACSPGGNGGGIIIIQAPEIIGNGFSISANGQNAPILSRDEAAGGGGAGGNILLYCSNFSGNLFLTVNGGNGGNIENTMFIGDAHGTGGGGGGGEIKLTSAAIPANVNISTIGGAAGLILHPGFYFMTNYGATDGSDGILTLNHPPISIDTLNFPNIGVDTLLCNINVFELDAGGIFTNYLWNTGEATQSIEVNSTGTYWVEVPGICGQALRDSIYLIFSVNNFDLPNSLNICNGDTTAFSLMIQGIYQWSNSESSLNFTPENSGLYILQITDSVGCDFSDSILITLNSCESFSFFIPNVFTPNDDGINDYYGIVTENAISQEVTILNRWGNKMIELNNPNSFWNGKLSDGKEAKEGIYQVKYKIIGINGEEKFGHTFFHLER